MYPKDEVGFIFDLICERPGITTAQLRKARDETGIMEWPLYMMLNKLTHNAKVGSRRIGLSVEWFQTKWWDSPDKHCVPSGWSHSDIEKFWREHPAYRFEGV